MDHYGELGPEDAGTEQMDSPAQAQTLADEVLHGPVSRHSPTESKRVKSGLGDDSTQDLVDHMRDMESSGIIDMGAFANEPNHDDDEDKYGKDARLEDDDEEEPGEDL